MGFERITENPKVIVQWKKEEAQRLKYPTSATQYIHGPYIEFDVLKVHSVPLESQHTMGVQVVVQVRVWEGS